MKTLVDADSYFKGDTDAPLGVVRRAWPHHLARYSDPEGFEGSITAEARLEHGRWIVDCPLGCGGAQFASKAHKKFFCVDCLHRGPNEEGSKAEGRWVRVKFPRDLDDIEEEILLRKKDQHRNWKPGESIDQLRGERLAMEGR